VLSNTQRAERYHAQQPGRYLTAKQRRRLAKRMHRDYRDDLTTRDGCCAVPHGPYEQCAWEVPAC